MFFLPGTVAAIAAAMIEQGHLAQLEQQRRSSLTPEQQDRELRKREVEALERQARAMENTRRDVKISFF